MATVRRREPLVPRTRATNATTNETGKKYLEKVFELSLMMLFSLTCSSVRLRSPLTTGVICEGEYISSQSLQDFQNLCSVVRIHELEFFRITLPKRFGRRCAEYPYFPL